MTNKKLQICSNASLRLGAGPISSVEAPSAGAAISLALFDQVYLNELAAYPWKFSLKQIELEHGLHPVDHPIGWSNMHHLPSPIIRLERLFLNGGRALKSYQITGSEVFSNQSKIYLEYVEEVDLSLAPIYFVLYLEYKLTAELAIPLTEQTSKAAYYQKLAEDQFTLASYLDSQMQPEAEFDLSYLYSARQ